MDIRLEPKKRVKGIAPLQVFFSIFSYALSLYFQFSLHEYFITFLHPFEDFLKPTSERENPIKLRHKCT
ncbi:hypothetical protein AKJ52_03025, partial [candidate division MSBL1 archaeon SCGC-AAA382C18]